MILLPVVGLVAGVLVGNRWALVLTALLGGIGFGLVAVFTTEISGWGDAFVWGDLAGSLLFAWAGIGIRRWRIAKQRAA